jgi:hypothetical protein
MKGKLKQGAIWIDRTIIESPYCIGLVQTETQYRHELKRLKVDDYASCEWIAKDKDANVTEIIKKDGNEQCFIVSIRKNKDTKPIEIIGLLIHEAVHCWQMIVRHMGEDQPSAEFEAYSIQSIAQKLIDAYKLK